MASENGTFTAGFEALKLRFRRRPTGGVEMKEEQLSGLESMDFALSHAFDAPFRIQSRSEPNLKVPSENCMFIAPNRDFRRRPAGGVGSSNEHLSASGIAQILPYDMLLMHLFRSRVVANLTSRCQAKIACFKP